MARRPHISPSLPLCLLCLPLLLFAFTPLQSAAQTLSDSACGLTDTAAGFNVVATARTVTDTVLGRTSVAAWRPQHSGYEITVDVTVNDTAYEGAAALAYNTSTLLERTGVSSCSGLGTVAHGRRIARGTFAFAVGTTPALQDGAWPASPVELYLAITLEDGENVTALVSEDLRMQCGCPDPDSCDTCSGGCSFECDKGTGRSSTAPKCRGVDTSAWLCIDCGALQFQPITTFNGSCMPCRKKCDGENRWAVLATCTAEQDSECKDCTVCKTWEVEVAPCTDTSDRQCRKTQERVAMEALRRAVGEPGRWNLTNSHCDWNGVTCSNDDSVVTDIELVDIELVGEPFSGDGGSLPSTIQALEQLKVLKLEAARLKGNVPSFLGSMKRLEVISFAQCRGLEGRLPTALLTLPKLSELNFADTGLSGPLFTGPKVTTSAVLLRTLELSKTALQGDLSPLQPINTTRLTLQRDAGNPYLFECSSLSVALALEECTLCGVPPRIANAGLPADPVRIAYPPPAPDVGDTVAYECHDEFATPTEAENTTFILLCEGDIVTTTTTTPVATAENATTTEATTEMATTASPEYTNRRYVCSGSLVQDRRGVDQTPCQCLPKEIYTFPRILDLVGLKLDALVNNNTNWRAELIYKLVSYFEANPEVDVEVEVEIVAVREAPFAKSSRRRQTVDAVEVTFAIKVETVQGFITNMAKAVQIALDDVATFQSAILPALQGINGMGGLFGVFLSASTTPSPSPSSDSSASSNPAIIGAVAGVMGAIILVLLVLLYRAKRGSEGRPARDKAEKKRSGKSKSKKQVRPYEDIDNVTPNPAFGMTTRSSGSWTANDLAENKGGRVIELDGVVSSSTDMAGVKTLNLGDSVADETDDAYAALPPPPRAGGGVSVTLPGTYGDGEDANETMDLDAVVEVAYGEVEPSDQSTPSSPAPVSTPVITQDEYAAMDGNGGVAPTLAPVSSPSNNDAPPPLAPKRRSSVSSPPMPVQEEYASIDESMQTRRGPLDAPGFVMQEEEEYNSLPQPVTPGERTASAASTLSRSPQDRISVRDTDARRKAREAREAALRAATVQEEAGPRRPHEWSFNDCVKWLRHHGFKDFVDTFYNNGFEGRHLIALQVQSFSGMRSHKRERVQELIDAIQGLKRAGHWEPPADEDEEVKALAPLQEEDDLPLPPGMSPLPAQGRPPAAAEKPNTPAWESARIQYFLTQNIGREEAKALLHHATGPDGEYLIRASKSQPGAYVLSMVHERKLHHFQIPFDSSSSRYVTSNGHRFVSLEELTKFFKTHNKEGLPGLLTHATHAFDHILEVTDDDEANYGFGDSFDDRPGAQGDGETYETVELTANQRQGLQQVVAKNTLPRLRTTSAGTEMYSNQAAIGQHR